MDFEGDPRVAGAAVDMGADEFHTRLYHTGDVVPGSTVAVSVVGTPGSGPVSLLLARDVLDPPRSTPYGDLHLALPMRRFYVGAIPARGILTFSRQVPSWWLPGEEHPMQAFVGPIVPGATLTNLHVLLVE